MTGGYRVDSDMGDDGQLPDVLPAATADRDAGVGDAGQEGIKSLPVTLFSSRGGGGGGGVGGSRGGGGGGGDAGGGGGDAGRGSEYVRQRPTEMPTTQFSVRGGSTVVECKSGAVFSIKDLRTAQSGHMVSGSSPGGERDAGQDRGEARGPGDDVGLLIRDCLQVPVCVCECGWWWVVVDLWEILVS